jgi:hypothetical protein
VHDLQPLAEAVLEVVHLVEEHHRPVRPVGVDQRHRRARLPLEHRRDDREDRRDARARGDRDVPLAGGRVDLGGEPAGRGHHLELVADPEPVDHTLAERPAGQSLDADPQGATGGRGADGVAAADVVATPDRQVLPMPEAVGLGEVGWDVERDRHRVVGELVDRRDPQPVEGGTHRALTGF